MSSPAEPQRTLDPLFRSVNRTQLSRQVREQLEAAIERGLLRPGEKLPSERELVEQFGVSRVSVREALRSLEAVGMIEVVAGRGCFVRSDLLENRELLVRGWLVAHGGEVLDLLKVRGAIESLAADEAARRADPVAVEQLQVAHERFAAAAAAKIEISQLVQFDTHFHDALADASGVALVRELSQQLNAHLSEARRITFEARQGTAAGGGRVSRSAREHGAIVTAVLAGDGKAAARAVARHIEATRKAIVAYTTAKEGIRVD